MRQLNLNVTPEFERDLRQFMKRKGIKRKSDAIREALREATERMKRADNFDFRSMIGVGLGRPNPHPKFKTDDDLWS